MPQAPDWQRYLEAGMQFTEMRRSQARRLANDLVEQGHLAREQVASTVDEILALSRRRTDEMREVVRKEVQRQLGGLGLATKADLAKLEKKMTKSTRAVAAKTKAKILMCHGAVDPFIKPEEIAAFAKAMNDGKFDYQFVSYAGAVHAFTNPGADKIAAATGLPIAYNEAADKRSWAHMKVFFKEIFAQ